VAHWMLMMGLGTSWKQTLLTCKPNSTKPDAPILKRVEPNKPYSLRDHFYPLRTSSQSCFDLPPIPKDVTFELNSDCFLNLWALMILICLFMSLRRCVHWFTCLGYQMMFWGWNSFPLLSKMMLRGGSMVLRLVLLNLRILLLISFLRDTFLLARPLELGMKSFLLSKLNMSLFGSTWIGLKGYLPNALTMV